MLVRNSEISLLWWYSTMAIENAEDGAALTTATTGHTTKTGKNKGKSGVFDWGARRAAYVDAFAQLIARPLCSLWTSPEPEFVNLFSKVLPCDPCSTVICHADYVNRQAPVAL